MDKHELKVIEEFENLIPALTTEEFSLLEKSVLEEGIREPLIVWGETLVDGHNRYKIAKKHNLEFKTISKDFDTFDEVKLWIIQNQLGRRNIITYVRGELGLEMKELLSKIGKDKQGTRTDLCQNSDKCIPHDTKKIIAEKTGISHDTISRIEKIKAVADEETLDKLRAGDTTINKVYNQIKNEDKQKEILSAEAEVAEEYTNDIIESRLFKSSYESFSTVCDLLITDPPYSTDIDDINEFVKWLPEKLSYVKETGSAFIFVGAYPEELNAYLNVAMPTQVLVWTYRNTLGKSPKNKYKLNWQAILYYRMPKAPELNCSITNELWAVHDVNAPDGRQNNRHHMWQKPLPLLERLIRHTTKKGDTVFDCFAGTGTSLVAATKLGRFAVGCEIDQDMIDIAVKRGVNYEYKKQQL